MGLARIKGTDAGEIINGTAGDEEIRAYGGDDTLNGLDGNDLLRGGKGNDILNGGNGNDRLRGDAGNDILTGGDGRDRFIFNNRGGQDKVTDYQDETDRLDFTNFGIEATATDSAFDILMSKADQVGSDVVFTMDGGETITIQNVTLSIFDAGDFRI